MTCRSCLTDPTAHIVADASVVINLNATKCCETILDALPNRVLVVDEVSLELEAGRHSGNTDADALQDDSDVRSWPLAAPHFPEYSVIRTSAIEKSGHSDWAG